MSSPNVADRRNYCELCNLIGLLLHTMEAFYLPSFSSRAQFNRHVTQFKVESKRRLCHYRIHPQLICISWLSKCLLINTRKKSEVGAFMRNVMAVGGQLANFLRFRVLCSRLRSIWVDGASKHEILFNASQNLFWPFPLFCINKPLRNIIHKRSPMSTWKMLITTFCVLFRFEEISSPISRTLSRRWQLRQRKLLPTANEWRHRSRSWKKGLHSGGEGLLFTQADSVWSGNGSADQVFVRSSVAGITSSTTHQRTTHQRVHRFSYQISRHISRRRWTCSAG